MAASTGQRRFPALLLALGLWALALPALSQTAFAITLTPSSGPVDSTVTVDGSGFDRDTDVVIEFDGQVVATVAADGPDWTGATTFTTTFTVPDLPADPTAAGYLVVAFQDGEPLAREVFTITPTLAIDPIRGPGGSEATLSGTGWEPDEPLTVEFPPGEVLLTLDPGDAAWSGNSRFSVVLTVPALTAGPYTVEAHQFERKLVQQTRFTVEATLEVDPDIGPVGSSSDATGTGFTDAFPLELVFDGEVVVELPAGDADWNTATSFVTPFTVPGRAPGTYTVEARQDCAGTCDISATDTFTVAGATLAVDPQEGVIGTSVEAIGEGWNPDEELTLLLGSVEVATLPADSGDFDPPDTFTTTFTVPDTVAGPYTVEACQRCGTAAELSATAEFTVLPRLAVDPDAGPIASETTASGDGWDEDQELRLFFDGEEVALVPAGAAAFTGGTSLAQVLVVPERPGGTYEVRACQRCGDPAGEISATAAFTIIPSIEVNPPLGPPGFVTFVEGRGFLPGAEVVLVWDPGVGTRRVAAGGDGRFRAAFLVMHRDRVGPRVVRATLPANEGLPEGERIPEPEAPFLAVPGTVQPSDFVLRR